MAVIQATQKIGAYVEVVGKPRDSKHGPGQYRPVLFHRNDKVGEEQKVWKSMSLADAEQFTKGQFVHLIPAKRDGKDTWDIEVADPRQSQSTPAPVPTAPTTPSVQQASLTPESRPEAFIAGQPKTAIAQYVSEMGDLYAHCYSTAIAKLPDGVSDGQVQGMASSLFIAAQRRFNLA